MNFISKNIHLIKCFIAYLLILIVFSLIYYQLYKSNPTHFLFNADIVRTQILNDSISVESKISEINKTIKNTENAIEALDSMLVMNENGKFIKESNRPGTSIINNDWILDYHINYNLVDYETTLSLSTRATRSGLDKSGKHAYVKIIDKKRNLELGNFRNHGYVEFDQKLSDNFLENQQINSKALKSLISDNQIYLQTAYYDLDEKETTFDNLKDYKNHANWNYLDFAYFTIISLPVNTYGDIIPNSRLTRSLVSLQSIIAWIILIVFINAKFDKKENENV